MLNLDNIVSNKNENKDMTGSSSLERNNWPFLVKQILYYI